MRRLFRISLTTFILPLLLLGCVQATPSGYSPQTAGDPAAQATLGARQHLDAAATYEASVQQATATAVEATRLSAAATAETSGRATGTAQAYMMSVYATSDAFAARATSQALDTMATRDQYASAATATTAAQMLAFDATLAADEGQRLHLQRQAEAAAVQRAGLWNRIWPPLLAVVVVTATASLMVYLANWWRRQTPFMAEPTARYLIDGRVLAPEPVATPARPKALPAPQEEDAPSVPVPLPRFQQGHILIAGETGSGKTTAIRAVLDHRPRAVILDPHSRPGDWGDHDVIGGARDFDAIAAYMVEMVRVLDDRYRQHNRGESNFSPLTVAVDEMPAIVADVGNEIADAWRVWLREGRKVGLFLVVATHSMRVKTLGIEGEGDLLENFTAVLTLGKLAQSRRPDLAHGPYPAVMETVGGARAVEIPAPPPAGNGHKPLLVAPEPRPVETEYGRVSPMQVTEILNLKREGWPNSHIETAVFKQENPGGAAYYKVRAVLDYYRNGGSGVSVE